MVITSPIPGAPFLGLKFSRGILTAIDFLGAAIDVAAECESAHSIDVMTALREYFDNPRSVPLIPLAPDGTPFQQRVWQVLQEIPCGETLTYGALARRLQSSARAVAGACRANPIPILIPCHRVVAVHGMGGYMGQRAGVAMGIKQWLLRHEGYAGAE